MKLFSTHNDIRFPTHMCSKPVKTWKETSNPNINSHLDSVSWSSLDAGGGDRRWGDALICLNKHTQESTCNSNTDWHIKWNQVMSPKPPFACIWIGHKDFQMLLPVTCGVLGLNELGCIITLTEADTMAYFINKWQSSCFHFCAVSYLLLICTKQYEWKTHISNIYSK